MSAVRRCACAAAFLCVLACVSGFNPAATGLARLTHGGCQPVLGAARAACRTQQHVRLPLRTRPQREVGPCMMTVIDALSSPFVLTAGAVGTVDGLGRVSANVPRYLARLYLNVQGVLAETSLVPPRTVPVESLQAELAEGTDVRAAFLKVCIASDREGQGTIGLDDLECFMRAHGKGGLMNLAPEWDFLRPKIVSALSIGEAMGMRTDERFDYVEYFQRIAGSATAYQKLQEAAAKELVEGAYEECKVLTSEYAKTFYLATRAMPEDQARATWAIYAWCRRVDELVDGPDVDPDPAVQAAGLSAWMKRLERIWDGDRYALAGLDTYDVAFADMIKSFPGGDIEPYRDMVRGMAMDVSDKVTYESWEELYLYCYRVASTVGLMTMPVMGTARGVTMEDARAPAVALGIALQITNILRDVGEDARERGRIYLPEEDMRRFGVRSEWVLARAHAEAPLTSDGAEAAQEAQYRELIAFEIARAREYYAEAEKGIELLAPSAQLPVAVAMELYREILDKIELNGFDNLSKRAYLSSFEKLRKVPGIFVKTKAGAWGR